MGDFVITDDGILTEYKGDDKTVIIPHGVRIIMSAFSECSSLKNINIPRSVRVIGSDTFYGCDNLTVTVSENFSLPHDVFSGCKDVIVK